MKTERAQLISSEAFFLDDAYNGTLQQQLQEIVTSRILSGTFAADAKLPSSRALAKFLGISRLTVTLAYNELVANEFLYAKGRSGYFVAKLEERPRRARTSVQSDEKSPIDWQHHIVNHFPNSSRLNRPKDWRSYPYPFVYGQMDSSLFNHQNWRLCALRALGMRDFETFSSDYYEDDDPILIEQIATQILPRRGIEAGRQNILVTVGAQNAIWLTAQLLLNREKQAVYEDPCYPQLREIVKSTGADIDLMKVNSAGWDMSRLSANTDVVFVTPGHHCPTNAKMGLVERRRFLEAAKSNDFIIVEDDYDFEMSMPLAPLPALKSLDQRDRVIYIGSFSKSIFPGLRLGYLVAPAEFIEDARALRALMLRHPPGHIQRAVAYFLSLGYYETQIRKLRQTYHERWQVTFDALKAHGFLSEKTDGEFGSSFWINAGEGMNTDRLAATLLEKGVVIEPGGFFSQTPSASQSYFRLGFSAIRSNLIPKGVELIAKTVEAMRSDKNWT